MPKLSRCPILAVLVFPFATPPLWAQGPAVASPPLPYEIVWSEPGIPEMFQVQEIPAVATQREYRSSHWKEGLATGAALGGVIGGIGMYAFCREMGDSPGEHCGFKALMGGAMAAVVGGGIGALIGGLFPKAVTDDNAAP